MRASNVVSRARRPRSVGSRNMNNDVGSKFDTARQLIAADSILVMNQLLEKKGHGRSGPDRRAGRTLATPSRETVGPQRRLTPSELWLIVCTRMVPYE